MAPRSYHGRTRGACSHAFGRRNVAILGIGWSVKFFFPLVILATLVCSHVAAQTVPVPRPRPPEAATPQGAQAVSPDNTATTSDCQRRLKRIAVTAGLPPVTGPGECAADDVVQLESILLPDRAQVAVVPPAMLRCSLAEAIAQWVRDDVAVRVRALGSSLKSLDNYASYDCRGRNNIAGAVISEHGKANALDIRSLKLTNGTVVKLTDPEVSRDFRESLRRSACARFATVLGPGSDGYHEDHIHVDLAERKNLQHLCHWDVREAEQDHVTAQSPVPLPRPRPAHGS
ncbi:MAG TPA: extensin family protein [Xanthobacteraceae bacterium]